MQGANQIQEEAQELELGTDFELMSCSRGKARQLNLGRAAQLAHTGQPPLESHTILTGSVTALSAKHSLFAA